MSASEIHGLVSRAKPNKEKILEFMCDAHDFSKDRVSKFADELISFKGRSSQKSIFDWS